MQRTTIRDKAAASVVGLVVSGSVVSTAPVAPIPRMKRAAALRKRISTAEW
jgi:hypothetical protein